MQGLAGVSLRRGSETRIIVDTVQDAISAADGVTSLRKAIAFAEATAGADEIVFASGVSRISMQTASLIGGSGATASFAYGIASGDELAINGDTDADGAADVEIFGGFVSANDVYSITPHFEIAPGAALTLEALELTGGGMAYFDAAANGGAATASNKSPAGADGADAYGSIPNEGPLALDRVRIAGATAIAQNANAFDAGDFVF